MGSGEGVAGRENHQYSLSAIGNMKGADIVREKESPSLLFPWVLGDLLHRDEELALKVKEFEKPGEKMMDGVLVDYVGL